MALKNRVKGQLIEQLERRFLMSVTVPMPAGGQSVHQPAVASNDGNDRENGPIIPDLSKNPQLAVSTVPANGDVNPYGVAFVPQNIAKGGRLHPGDILVSNFNNSTNAQGTGTTIVDISPAGKQSLFFQGKTGIGLTTALGVVQRGFVLVGNLPTTDGTSATVQQGSLIVLDRFGKQVLELKDKQFLDGPWDLTLRDEGPQAVVFISNALNGTVTRLVLAIPRPDNGHAPRVESETTIGSGYAHRTDPNALVIGPTGVAYDVRRDLLYVASTGDNAVYAIDNAGGRTKDAGKGRIVYQDAKHLRGPLGLALTPDGTLLTTNGDAVNSDPNDNSELIEFSPTKGFIAERQIDTMPGAAFGLATNFSNDAVTLAAVDDATNVLDIWIVKR